MVRLVMSVVMVRLSVARKKCFLRRLVALRMPLVFGRGKSWFGCLLESFCHDAGFQQIVHLFDVVTCDHDQIGLGFM